MSSVVVLWTFHMLLLSCRRSDSGMVTLSTIATHRCICPLVRAACVQAAWLVQERPVPGRSLLLLLLL